MTLAEWLSDALLCTVMYFGPEFGVHVSALANPNKKAQSLRLKAHKFK